MAKRKSSPESSSLSPVPVTDRLVGELREMIEATRARVATAANVELTMLYWRVGRRIHDEILSGERAPYGDAILATLSRQLVAEYGRGFAEKNLRRMVQFAEVFPDDQIVVTLSRQLSWSHFLAILPLKQPFQREYYAEMCRVERWSVRTLRSRIDSMLYERTALSRKPEEVIERDLTALREAERMTPDLVMRDPYMLDFLDLHDSYAEADLEAAIVREMERFLLELGAGFTFAARQKRISVDGDDYYLDLLFYNRKLKRLVAVELKLGEFKPEYKGQMELYLRWLDKHEREGGEESPLGIILCAGKKAEQIELLELNRSGIHVAEYLTELPSREILARKLQQATERARRQVERRSQADGSEIPPSPKSNEGPMAPKKRGGRRP